jgi:hypothetical protein
VEFQPLDGNYKNVITTVTVTVTQPPSRLKFKGFFQPVYNLPVLNTVAAGRAIPVRFIVEGAQGSNVLKAGSPTSVPTACNSAVTKSVAETVDEPTSGLQKLGNHYTYVWRTSPSWAGNCRKLILTLVDGSKHEAAFRFAKASKSKAITPVKRGKNKGSKDGSR